MRIVAIDPGLSGAIAGSDCVYDMPTLAKGGKSRVTREADGAAVVSTLRALSPDRVIIERVASRPGQGVAGMFSLGHSLGVVTAAAWAVCDIVDLIPPQVWKARLGLLGQDKEASLLLARKLFPALAGRLARKMDHGRAEALLLVYYGACYL